MPSNRACFKRAVTQKHSAPIEMKTRKHPQKERVIETEANASQPEFL